MRTTGILLNVVLKPFEPLIGHIATAEIKVRAGAVLPGSRGPEHQATGALPQPTHNTGSEGQRLAELTKKSARTYSQALKTS